MKIYLQSQSEEGRLRKEISEYNKRHEILSSNNIFPTIVVIENKIFSENSNIYIYIYTTFQNF